MTNPKDASEKRTDREAEAQPRTRDDVEELDAEIVGDLEAEDDADVVRGGCKPTYSR
jgi:hypothetical protein